MFYKQYLYSGVGNLCYVIICLFVLIILSKGVEHLFGGYLKAYKMFLSEMLPSGGYISLY